MENIRYTTTKCPKCGMETTPDVVRAIDGLPCLERQVAALQKERDELREKVDAVTVVINSATEPGERHDTDNMDDVFSEGVEAGYWDAINEIRRAMSMQESPTN